MYTLIVLIFYVLSFAYVFRRALSLRDKIKFLCIHSAVWFVIALIGDYTFGVSLVGASLFLQSIPLMIQEGYEAKGGGHCCAQSLFYGIALSGMAILWLNGMGHDEGRAISNIKVQIAIVAYLYGIYVLHRATNNKIHLYIIASVVMQMVLACFLYRLFSASINLPEYALLNAALLLFALPSHLHFIAIARARAHG